MYILPLESTTVQDLSSDLVWLVVTREKEKEEKMNNYLKNFILYLNTFTNHVISSFCDRLSVFMRCIHPSY